MAIQEGPFQNIVSISSASKRYFVAQITGKVRIYDNGAVIHERQTNYTPLEDNGELRASFSNYDGTIFALSVQFADGTYGLAVFGETLQIYNTYNTGTQKPYMVGPCSSTNNDFICMIGNTATRISLYQVPNVNQLTSTVDIFIPDSEFTTSVGADYTATETINSRHVAPLPNGGFCYLFPLELKGESGTFGSGPYVYRGFVIVFFNSLGTQGITLYVKPPSFYWFSAAGGHTIIDGNGAIRKQSSSQKDIYITPSRTYAGEKTSIQYNIEQFTQLIEAQQGGNWAGALIDTIGIGGGKYFGEIRKIQFGIGPFPIKFIIGDFNSGLVEVASSENLLEYRFINKRSFKQLQNPAKSNLVEFYRSREILGTAYIYIGDVAKDNLSDYQLSLQNPVGSWADEYITTASPGSA